MENIQELQNLVENYLTESAIADIAINDLGLTLDEPAVLYPYSSIEAYGIETGIRNIVRYENLMAMSYHLCLLNGGIDLAKKLAKKSGLLNYKISVPERVTEESIEYSMKKFRKLFFIGLWCYDYEFDLAIHYKNVFKAYCLTHMDDNQLEERIKSKIENLQLPPNHNFEQKPIL